MTSEVEPDVTCLKILMVLNRKPSGVRYSELEEVLKQIGAGLTPPTLSHHLLKHLVKEDIVNRTIDESRNTTYKINYTKFTNSKKYVERMDKMIRDYNKNIEYLKSFSVEQQITLISGYMAIKDLNKLKSLIEYMSDRGSFDKGFTYLLWNDPTFESYERLIVSQCVGDEEYKKEVLKKIDDLLVKLMGEI
ncbi:transcriptional regulator [Candidatus Bathyarchaeota archaeon]|nr:transcriptional regulator [Candidatus Bathyarchaeota archaeon]